MQFPETTIRREETSEMRRNKSLFASFLKSLENNEVHVGWFGGQNRQGRNNPTIVYVNEFGTIKTGEVSTDKKKSIPWTPYVNQPRSFIRPAMEEDGKKICDILHSSVNNFLKNPKESNIKDILNNVGDKIKSSLQAGMKKQHAPLSPYTLKKRKKRGNNSEKDWIDTGEVYNSIEVRIKEKNNEPF